MMVMGLDDFDIDLVAQYLCSGLKQLKTEVDPDTHVRRIYDGDRFGSLFDLGL